MLINIGDYTPMGLTDEGDFYYGHNFLGQNIVTAKIDMDAREVLEPPKRTVLRRQGQQSTPEWSPDGKYLACRAVLDQGAGILIRSEETGDIRELAPAFNGPYGLNYHFLRWAPNGESIMMAGGLRDGPRGLCQISVASGEVKMLCEGEIYDCDWSPDGKTVYYEMRDDDVWKLVRYELSSGLKETLLEVNQGEFNRLSVSPDGQLLAYDNGGINVLATQGGKPRKGAQEWWSFICLVTRRSLLHLCNEG